MLRPVLFSGSKPRERGETIYWGRGNAEPHTGCSEWGMACSSRGFTRRATTSEDKLDTGWILLKTKKQRLGTRSQSALIGQYSLVTVCSCCLQVWASEQAERDRAVRCCERGRDKLTVRLHVAVNGQRRPRLLCGGRSMGLGERASLGLDAALSGQGRGWSQCAWLLSPGSGVLAPVEWRLDNLGQFVSFIQEVFVTLTLKYPRQLHYTILTDITGLESAVSVERRGQQAAHALLWEWRAVCGARCLVYRLLRCCVLWHRNPKSEWLVYFCAHDVLNLWSNANKGGFVGRVDVCAALSRCASGAVVLPLSKETRRSHFELSCYLWMCERGTGLKPRRTGSWSVDDVGWGQCDGFRCVFMINLVVLQNKALRRWIYLGNKEDWASRLSTRYHPFAFWLVSRFYLRVCLNP